MLLNRRYLYPKKKYAPGTFSGEFAINKPLKMTGLLNCNVTLTQNVCFTDN